MAEADLKTCPDCAETVKGDALVCRFCGYRFDRGVSREGYFLQQGRKLIAATMVVALLIVWATGVLDGPFSLYNIGLNSHDCYQTQGGSVSCGGSASTDCSALDQVITVIPGVPQDKCFHGVL